MPLGLRSRQGRASTYPLTLFPPGDLGKVRIAWGRRGAGKKGNGGAARAAKMTPERRAEIAKKAATKRWSQSSTKGS